MMLVFVGLSALPAVIALGVAGFRRPLHTLLPLFAAFVPYGSAIALPGVPERFGSISSLLGYGLIAAIGWKLVTRRWKLPFVSVEVPVWLLLLGWTGATTLWSIDRRGSALDLIPFLGIVLLYILVRLSPVDRESVHRTELAIVLGGALGATYALFQLVTGTLPQEDVGAARFGADLTDPNHLAAALTLPLVVAAARALTAGRKTRPLYVLAVLMLLLAILLTGSRGGALAAVLALLTIAVLSSRRAISLLGAAVAVAVIGAVTVLLPTLMPSRLTSTDSNLRTDIWLVGLHACSDYCLTGSGWGTFGLVYFQTLPTVPEADVSGRGQLFLEPHNIWILAVIELGVLGVALMTTGLALVARDAARIRGQHRGPAAAALAALLLTAALVTNLEYKYFWMVLVYVAMVGIAEGQRDGPAPVGQSSPRLVA